MIYTNDNHFTLFDIVTEAASYDLVKTEDFRYFMIEGYIWPNLIFSVAFDTDISTAALDLLQKHISEKKAPARILCTPSTPETTRSYLRERFEHYIFWTAMSMPLHKAIPTINIPGFSVRKVQLAEDLAQWCDMLYTGKEISTDLFVNIARDPKCHFYIGYIHNEPVATCWAIHHNNSIGLYAISTKKAYSGRGIASEITCYALRKAKAEGITLAHLQATHQAVSLYHKIGFSSEGILDVFQLNKPL